MAFSPDGTMIADYDDHAIKQWDKSTGSLLKKIEGKQDALISIAFSLDGTNLIVYSGKTIKFLDIANGNEIKNLPYERQDQHIPSSCDFNFVCKYSIWFKRNFSCSKMIIEKTIISQFNEIILKQSKAIFLQNEEV